MTQTGIFIGTEEGATERLAAYTSWAGEAPDNVLSYLNDGSWSGFDSSISYAFNQNSHVPGVWSVPLTVEGTSLEEVGTGAHNDYFLKAAQQLAQATPSSDGNIYVRVGWEFNGD